jgi:hypothetical protein
MNFEKYIPSQSERMKHLISSLNRERSRLKGLAKLEDQNGRRSEAKRYRQISLGIMFAIDQIKKMP